MDDTLKENPAKSNVKPRKKPKIGTIKQQRVLKILAENPSISMGQAMLKAGYSQFTAIAPQNLTQSKTWQQLQAQYLKPGLIFQRHKQLLNKKETKRFFNHETGEWETIKTNEIDPVAVGKGVELAYKKGIAGGFAPEKRVQLNVNTETRAMSDEELNALAYGTISE